METRTLRQLRSVGPATIGDLQLLGVTTVEQLARRRPADLYTSLCNKTGHRHDPCAEDVFAAAVAQARDPGLPRVQCDWWYWSRLRKNGLRATGK
ncbi:MAG: mitomycin resistance protein [Candidatus Wallbacteria bacterium]|nr:mitomycin resistance protein [Candidatus Wallbacteria bacterium]